VNVTREKTTMRDYLKHNRGLLIIGVLFMLIGIWVDIQWIFKHLSGILYFLNLLPGTLFLSEWYLASKYQNRRWLIINVGVIITLFISMFIFFMNAIALVFITGMTPITDISRYNEILEQMGDSDLTRHFPMSIPESAEAVKFEYIPKILQGGEHFQLRMRLPHSEINNLQEEYSSQAKFKFIGGNTNDHENSPGGVPTTFFYTSGTGDQSFPDDYEIFVLNAEPLATFDPKWNHGFSYGVAISQEKSEIVYWSEYW
jgi:hypothetical protein